MLAAVAGRIANAARRADLIIVSLVRVPGDPQLGADCADEILVVVDEIRVQRVAFVFGWIASLVGGQWVMTTST